jgi:hypothetical protein
MAPQSFKIRICRCPFRALTPERAPKKQKGRQASRGRDAPRRRRQKNAKVTDRDDRAKIKKALKKNGGQI